MQLFTIGLYELNLDGTRKKDGYGRDISTYSNDNIVDIDDVCLTRDEGGGTRG